jgi:uncharacterized membrane protein HdeD (DUF308 family)
MPTKNNQTISSSQSGFVYKLMHAKQGLVFRGVLGIIIGYAFLSRAFDTGSWIQYFCSVVFTVLGVRLIKRSFTVEYNGKSKARKFR